MTELELITTGIDDAEEGKRYVARRVPAARDTSYLDMLFLFLVIPIR